MTRVAEQVCALSRFNLLFSRRVALGLWTGPARSGRVPRYAPGREVPRTGPGMVPSCGIGVTIAHSRRRESGAPQAPKGKGKSAERLRTRPVQLPCAFDGSLWLGQDRHGRPPIPRALEHLFRCLCGTFGVGVRRAHMLCHVQRHLQDLCTGCLQCSSGSCHRSHQPEAKVLTRATKPRACFKPLGGCLPVLQFCASLC